MKINFALADGFARRLREKSLFAFVLIVLIAGAGVAETRAQNNFTKDQFSRLNLAARAGFFQDEILRAAQAEGVDPNVLWTIAYNETRFRPWLVSPKNARGLMQFIPATAARFDLSDPFNPVSAIRAAARYVRYLSSILGKRLDSILAAYNSGEGTVLAFLYGRTVRTNLKVINPKALKTIGGIPPYAETIGYVGRGLKLYRWLIARGTFPANTARAYFPWLISPSVSQIPLVDRELGKVPDFKTNVPASGTNQPQTAGISDANGENSQAVAEQNPQSGSTTLIYYDSRSGSRFVVGNGNQIKLAENGAVVITGNARPKTTNKARSTFFAATLK